LKVYIVEQLSREVAMEKQVYYLIIAGIITAMIPLVPQIIKFRILVLRKLHINWLANSHETHFPVWVTVIRVILGVIATLMAIVGVSGL
jgi:hypothetical protein